MNKPLKIVGISGSLRKDSYNSAALRVAQGMMPEGSTLEILDISDLPLYNSDLEVNKTFPAAVQALREAIFDADGILFACPEYNYSISSPLKNAIDWASRGKPQPFDGKPAAILGASMGPLGTARAQYHLRQVGVFVNLLFVNKPEVFIGVAQTKFDAEGNLTDEPTRKIMGQLLQNLVDWTRRLKG